MNKTNTELNKENNQIEQYKQPCFQCIVRNLPGGRMGGFCSPCSDCEAKYKREEKQQHERYLAETNVGLDKEWRYKNSKCETCQMPFSQMKEKKIPQRVLNNKLYCQGHFVDYLVSKAKEDTEKQKKSHGEK